VNAKRMCVVAGTFLVLAACGDDKTNPSTDTVGDDTLTSDTQVVEDTLAEDGLTSDTLPSGDTLQGDTLAGDTTPPTDTSEPPLEGCDDPIPAATNGVCTVTAGAADTLLLRGDVILPEGLLERGSVLVVNGYVTCSGCDCKDRPEAATATVIACAEGVISPGLINAHDHITFTQDTPKSHGTTRYDHRHEWRTGANGKPEINTSQNSHAMGDAWGEARQVLAGTTSLFGSGAEMGFLRNLDRSGDLERISHDNATYATFPLGDSGGTIVSSGCSNYKLPATTVVDNTAAYVPHVSEGIIAGARNEFVCLSGLDDGGVDVVADNTSIIHGIGLNASDIALMAGDAAALVWSPRSNTDLYGFTADAPLYDKLGCRIALGTDWTPSGSVNMLRELRCAEEWNEHWDNYFTDAQLVAMATYGAAEALGFDDLLGSLKPGKAADLVIWDARTNTGYRAILDAQVDDVVLVLRGGTPLTVDGQTYFRRGTPLYGDGALVDALSDRTLDWSKYDHTTYPNASSLPAPCEAIDVCGQSKKLCVAEQLEDRSGSPYTTWSLARFRSEVGSQSYDLFFCDVPTNEPSCVPFRPNEFTGQMVAGDQDGDGFADTVDNCPSYFNPPRPLDGQNQRDTDADGLGDVCDPCPFDANTTACSSVDPDDIDNDGILNSSDNCPSVANPDQADADLDDIGDACDACPNESNAGGVPCSVTVYAVKKGEVALGTSVGIKNMMVTAVGSNFYHVQLPATATGFDGVEYSAIYVFNGSDPKPPVGATVNVAGVVGDYFGQIQISNSSFTQVAAGDGTTMAPTIVNPADVAKGGAKEAAYEAALVTVQNVTVLDTTPAGETGETVANEFTVTGNLSVDDGLFLVSPFPVEGQTFTAITGVLRYTWNRDKLMPRKAEDFLAGTPLLYQFEPATSWVYVGAAVQSSSPALTVRLTSDALVDTFVAITSSAASDLAVQGGGVTIPAGQRSAVVQLSAAAANADVTLTASLDDVTLTAHVVVLASTHVPKPVSVIPDGEVVTRGEAMTFTVTLDTPAPAAGQVVTLTATGPYDVLPANVSFAAGELTKTFSVTAKGDQSGVITVTATTAAGSAEGEVEVIEASLVGLLIVEVFYNPTGTDDGLEWVKLYNGTGASVNLANYSLGYGGTDYTYGKLQLSGTVAAGACFIVGGTTSNATNGSPTFSQATDFNPDIQNAGTETDPADAVALFNVTAAQITASSNPIDAVIYGGVNSNNLKGAGGAVGTVQVTNAPGGSSIVRTSSTAWTTNATPNSEPCIVIVQ